MRACDDTQPQTIKNDLGSNSVNASSTAETLLKLDVLIRGYKCVELTGRKRQQLSILRAGPSDAWYGGNFASYK